MRSDSSSPLVIRSRLGGQRRGNRRRWWRLAQAPEAVAGRPIGPACPLWCSRHPEPPGAP
eukprot:scaffold34887_cov61-Phaeocystis_antarctica.AAC.8